MKLENPYKEYVVCDDCGYMKYCRLVARKFLCKACDKENLTEKRS